MAFIYFFWIEIVMKKSQWNLGKCGRQQYQKAWWVSGRRFPLPLVPGWNSATAEAAVSSVYPFSGQQCGLAFFLTQSLQVRGVQTVLEENILSAVHVQGEGSPRRLPKPPHEDRLLPGHGRLILPVSCQFRDLFHVSRSLDITLHGTPAGSIALNVLQQFWWRILPPAVQWLEPPPSLW